MIGHRIDPDHFRYSPGDGFGRECQRRLHWMGRKHCLPAARRWAGSSGSLESEADWVLLHRTSLVPSCSLSAGAVVEARWPIEDRIGNHLMRCLAVRRDWSGVGMGTTGIWWHHGAVGWGSDEEEKHPWLGT